MTARLVRFVCTRRNSFGPCAADLTNAKTGTLTIATTHTQSRYALPQIFANFRRYYPDVEIVLLQGGSRDIPSLLVDGQADIGLATDTMTDVSELLTFPFYTWKHCVVVPRKHPLVALERATLAEIASYTLVTYGPGLTGRKQIDDAFHDAGLEARISLSALVFDVIKTYIKLDLGVGILASMAFDPSRDRDLRKINTLELFRPSTIGSNVDLLGDLDSVVDLDAKVAHGAFDLRMAEQKLHSSEVARSPIDQHGLRPSQRMRAELCWVEPDAGDPLLHQPSILPGCQPRLVATARE